MSCGEVRGAGNAGGLLRRGREKELALILVIFLFAFAVRLVYLNQIRKNPFFDNPIVDCETYDAMASGIASGDWIGTEAFFQAPLYPYFLGILYKVLGHDYFRARLLQILLGSLNCVLLYLLGRTLFSRVVGVMASSIASLYSILFFFESELLSPVIVVFLALSLVLALGKARESPAAWKFFFSGIVGGFLAIAYPQLLLFIGAALLWMWMSLRPRRAKVSVGLYMGLFSLGTGLVISAVTLRNYAVEKDFVLISANGGLNLYLGNNPDYEKTAGMRPGLEWEELNLITAKLGIHKPSQKSRYFASMAVRFMREEPVHFLTLLGRKTRLYWSGDEVMRNQEIYPFRRYSPLLKSLLWKRPGLAVPFGLVAPLSLLGMGICLARWRDLLLPFLFIGTQFASTVIFFVASRYRAPVLPFLILFAAFAIKWLFEQLRARRSRQLALAVPLLVFLFLAVNSGLGDMPESFNADAYYNLGAKYAGKGDLKAAMAEFSRALAADPGHCDTHLGLGRTYVELGLYDQGLSELGRALEGCPHSALIHLNIGIAYQKKGEYEKAAAEYGRALDLYPDYRDGHFGLATALDSMGCRDDAILEYRKVIERDPDYFLAYLSMGDIYFDEGMNDLALEAYRGAARANPGLEDELLRRADLFMSQGLYAEAARDYLSVTRLNGGNVKANFNLGYIYAKQNLHGKAVAAYERVLELEPDMLVARFNLGDLYLAIGEKARAEEQFRRIKKDNPDFPGIDRAINRIRSQ